jgi:hypothetical protein
MTDTNAQADALRKDHSLDELRDMADELGLPTSSKTKLQLATAILDARAKDPPAPPGDRAEALARMRDQDFPPPADDEGAPPVKSDPLEEARRAAQLAEEESRDANKPDPAAAARGEGVPEEPIRQGRLVHTGRWIPEDVIQYVNTRRRKVVRKPTITVAGHGEVDNVLDDLPEGIAFNFYQRGLVRPEMA